jgi:hypothetical protein
VQQAGVPGGAEPLAVALHPRDRQVPVERLVLTGVRAEGHDGHSPVTELDEVGGRRPGGGAVVDADPRHGDVVRLVDDDRGQAAIERREHARIARRCREDDEAVDGGTPHDARALLARLGGRDQQQPGARVLEAARHAAHEDHGGLVLEGVGEAVGEDQPERAGPPGAQPPGDRIGPRVAEPARLAEHALAHGLGQQLGPVEGIRRRAHRDTGGAGDVAQRGPTLDPWVRSHGPAGSQV